MKVIVTKELLLKENEVNELYSFLCMLVGWNELTSIQEKQLNNLMDMFSEFFED